MHIDSFFGKKVYDPAKKGPKKSLFPGFKCTSTHFGPGNFSGSNSFAVFCKSRKSATYRPRCAFISSKTAQNCTIQLSMCIQQQKFTFSSPSRCTLRPKVLFETYGILLFFWLQNRHFNSLVKENSRK